MLKNSSVIINRIQKFGLSSGPSATVTNHKISNGWNEVQIPVPWGHISGKTLGDPQGPPVLAVHGILDNSGTFDTLLPLLSKSFFIVAIDLPGHGLSSHIPPGIPYHYIDFVLAIRRVVNHFQWTRFSWLGHSLGGGLGSFCASVFRSTDSSVGRHKNVHGKVKTDEVLTFHERSSEPPLIDRLVVLDLLFPITGVTGDYYVTKLSVAVDHFHALEETAGEDKLYNFSNLVKKFMAVRKNVLSAEAAEILLKRGSKLNSVEQKYYLTRDLRLEGTPILGINEEKYFEILSKLNSHVLFIKAKESSLYSKPGVYQHVLDIYKKNCRSFQNEEVPGNHYFHLMEPEKIADMVDKFLKGEKN